MNEPDAVSPMARLRKLLHQPTRLGMALNGVLLAAWYGAAYTPLHKAIIDDEERVAAERERLELAREVEQLRVQAGRYTGLLPEPEEGDAWIPFLMGGVRQFPIKLIALEPRPPAKVGPYRAAVHRLVIEGPYPELEKFLRWLEGSPRMIRVDSVRVASRATNGRGAAAPGAAINEMQLMLLGIEG